MPHDFRIAWQQQQSFTRYLKIEHLIQHTPTPSSAAAHVYQLACGNEEWLLDIVFRVDHSNTISMVGNGNIYGNVK